MESARFPPEVENTVSELKKQGHKFATNHPSRLGAVALIRYCGRMIDVVIEDPRWTQLGLRDLARDSVSATLDAVQVSAPFELSVLGCDDARIAALNTEFRGKPEPTNVLSWPETDLSAEKDGDLPQAPVPTPDGVLSLGDIAIAYETCVREAAEQGKPPEHHVAHLLVHGTLHLLGYDHIRDRDATRMEALEVKLLGILGVPDPY